MQAVANQYAWGKPEMYEEGFHSGRALAHTGLADGWKTRSASLSRLAGRLQGSLATILLLSGFNTFAQSSVTLAWDASTSTTVVSYKVYYGGATKVYTNWVDAGGSNIVTVAGLKNGARYFFAATAVDNLGQESSYSAETNYIPGGATGNTSPFISAIANQAVSVDTATPALSFSVGDGETPASSLTVSGGSDNAALVNQSGIVFGGSGSGRTVTVTPLSGASGSATITVAVSDGTNSASTSFLLSVNNSRPANTPPTISSIAG